MFVSNSVNASASTQEAQEHDSKGRDPRACLRARASIELPQAFQISQTQAGEKKTEGALLGGTHAMSNHPNVSRTKYTIVLQADNPGVAIASHFKSVFPWIHEVCWPAICVGSGQHRKINYMHTCSSLKFASLRMPPKQYTIQHARVRVRRGRVAAAFWCTARFDPVGDAPPHCHLLSCMLQAGASRSASIVLGYLMWSLKWSYDQASKVTGDLMIVITSLRVASYRCLVY